MSVAQWIERSGVGEGVAMSVRSGEREDGRETETHGKRGTSLYI